MGIGEISRLLVRTSWSILSFGQMNLVLIFGDHQEEDIDRLISDAKIYEDGQGTKRIPDEPLQVELPLRATIPGEEESRWEEKYRRARQNRIQKRKQLRVQRLLTAFNSLSADLFAAISVAERQISVLQDLRYPFSISGQTKTKDYEKEYTLPQNRFDKKVALIPILSENPEHIWPNTLDTIDEVVRGRKLFIKKVKKLAENMDIRRKIV